MDNLRRIHFKYILIKFEIEIKTMLLTIEQKCETVVNFIK